MADGRDTVDGDSGEENDGGNWSPSNQIVPGLNSGDETMAVITGVSGDREGRENGNQSSSSAEDIEAADDFLFFVRKLREDIGSVNMDIAPISKRPPRGPATRHFPPGRCLCFGKILSLTDANQSDGKLEIVASRAKRIPSCPYIPIEAHGSRKSVDLMVFDYENTQYNMMITGYNYQGILRFSIHGEWIEFVRTHNLHPGDLTFFYTNRDMTINPNDLYYVVLFSRRSDGDFKYGFLREEKRS